MMTRRHLNAICAVTLLIVAAFGCSFGQTVVKFTGAPSPLTDRWTWAAGEAGRRGIDKGYWIGYSIERMMGERSFTGSFHSDSRRNHPTLHELLTGMTGEPTPDGMEGFAGSMSGNATVHEGGRKEKLVKKEVGFLFHIAGAGRKSIDGLKVSNLSLKVDFGGDPLFWLGDAGTDESVAFLITRFDEAPPRETKEAILMGVGFHRDAKGAYDFLKKVLQGPEDGDLRGDAAFWLGQAGTDDARNILTETAFDDASEEVREKAIFALSEMEGEKALDDIISIARKHRNGETRKHAAFWLGQKASRKALGALTDLAYNDGDTEVQRSAMFALTQMDEGEGVDELVRIARTHPNPKIRKDAIFWLGQSENPKALDVLVEIAKGK